MSICALFVRSEGRRFECLGPSHSHPVVVLVTLSFTLEQFRIMFTVNGERQK